MLNAGDGREATMEAITAPEDWRPIYQDNHLAPEFSYVFYPADGLTPSAGHTVVLDFIGAFLLQNAPCAVIYNRVVQF